MVSGLQVRNQVWRKEGLTDARWVPILRPSPFVFSPNPHCHLALCTVWQAAAQPSCSLDFCMCEMVTIPEGCSKDRVTRHEVELSMGSKRGWGVIGI